MFEKLGLVLLSDLIRFFPRAYNDYSHVVSVAEAPENTPVILKLSILSEPALAFFHGISLLSCRATDGRDTLMLKWFNMPYQKGRLHLGDTWFVSGKVDRKKGTAVINPVLWETLPGIVPVYPTTKGLKQPAIRNAIGQAFERIDPVELADELPPALRLRYGLLSCEEAYRELHFPTETERLKNAQRRLDFENLLFYLIAIEMKKRSLSVGTGIAFNTESALEGFTAGLGFTPTGAQVRAMKEIAADMASPRPMNRLVQGDVGSGKTAVAAFALSVSARSGYQGAFLAPTELLAEQHYKNLSAFFPDDCALLTGSMSTAERNTALKKIAEGSVHVVIGTHALLENAVTFKKLGLVVTDEQHRFGVRQRGTMAQKGIRPDMLVMSATPIPRTLAMQYYGDLDISVIDELPPGRLPVKTRFITARKRKEMYDYLVSEAKNGNRSYVVCPYIEPPEEESAVSVTSLYEELRKRYPETAIGILHGRMPNEEKTAAMEAFRNGEISILISTTVIEVGVDVREANVIVIEGADRFGLAQLHQLRGRVGRGDKQAYCFLLSDSGSETAHDRIQTLTETNDGFKVAEKDLEMRGPGDYFGVRQHGASFEGLLAGFTDPKLLSSVKEAVAEIMDIPTVENNALVEKAEEIYCKSSTIVMN